MDSDAALALENSISLRYAELIMEDHVDEIESLRDALDVSHTHILRGDTTDWENLSDNFRTHFLSRNFNPS